MPRGVQERSQKKCNPKAVKTKPVAKRTRSSWQPVGDPPVASTNLSSIFVIFFHPALAGFQMDPLGKASVCRASPFMGPLFQNRRSLMLVSYCMLVKVPWVIDIPGWFTTSEAPIPYQSDPTLPPEKVKDQLLSLEHNTCLGGGVGGGLHSILASGVT